MQNDYSLEHFHHFDGVNHADYQPQVGDIVNILNPITGIDNAGNSYTLKGSGFWEDNVAQIQAIGNDTITIDDKTDHSPIVIVHPPSGAFELASWLNTKLFKPYSTIVTVSGNVVTGVENAALTASNLVKNIGSNLSWIIIVAVIIGAIIIFSKLKKAL